MRSDVLQPVRMSRFQATIYVRLPEQLRSLVSAEAHRRMLKPSDVVREALAEHFANSAPPLLDPPLLEIGAESPEMQRVLERERAIKEVGA